VFFIRPDILIKNRLRDRSPPDWKLAVISFRDRKGSDGLARAFRAEPIAHTIFYGQEAFAESPFVYETSLDGNKIGVITRCIWGGPHTAILVEELAQLGVKFLIGYGSAGSIDASLELGQQVVVTAAVPNDGTSRAYGQIEKIEVDSDLKSLGRFVRWL
jgi:purine-nucleoside phosphorylase